MSKDNAREVYSYVDEPVDQSHDGLGCGIYYDGLAEFIKKCETPMTIAIQGDWGSGKTSTLKMIEHNLNTSEEGSKCHVIWFHTWQYAQFNMEQGLQWAILSEFSRKLQEITGEKATLKGQVDKVMKAGKTLLPMLVDGKAGGRSGDLVEALINFTEGGSYSAIESLHNDIQNAINQGLQLENERAVVFIDDLDRIEPKAAIDVLEAVKNFLDCKRCVFVLAIDSSVIIRGVKDKYGEEMTDDKAQKYFEKIIQLPFYLPVSRYNMESYLEQFLSKDHIYLKEYAAAATILLGRNPRAIKRVFNLYRLNEIIFKEEQTEKNKYILFIILLLQITDVEKYSTLVTAAKESDEKLRLLLREERFQMMINLMQKVDQAENMEHENELSDELLGILIELLGNTSKISSVTEELDAESENATIEQFKGNHNIKLIIEALEKGGLYRIQTLNADRIEIYRNDEKLFMISHRDSKYNLTGYGQCPISERDIVDGIFGEAMFFRYDTRYTISNIGEAANIKKIISDIWGDLP